MVCSTVGLREGEKSNLALSFLAVLITGGPARGRFGEEVDSSVIGHTAFEGSSSIHVGRAH